jgi:hypothetical protein
LPEREPVAAWEPVITFNSGREVFMMVACR